MGSNHTLFLYCSIIDGYDALRSAPWLCDAVEAHLKHRLADARENGSFVGCGFETDESPPSGPKWAGLRFQISIAYFGFIPPADEWDRPEWSEQPPIKCIRHLCDIINAPGKDGATVAKIVTMQLARMGCSLADVVSGSTDGGGENEGCQGAHGLIEEYSPLYVRRRGLEHLSWNFCSAGLAASGDMCKHMRQLSAYLRDGVTWQRLKDIAVTTPAQGGA